MPETQTVTATPMPQPETEVTTTPQPQANNIQVTNPLTGDVISVARPETTVMEQAGNLLGDLFSVPGDLLSSLGPTDAEIAAQAAANIKAIQDRITIDKAVRGEDYYGQNLTPAQTQAYSQAGIAAVPAPKGFLERGNRGGQLEGYEGNIPARFTTSKAREAAKKAGVQMKGEIIGLGGRY